MDEKALPTFEYLDDEDDSPSLIDRGLHATESIDLKGLVDELDGFSGSPDPSEVQASSFGRLMEALPIPALLIDASRHIVFANQACEKISLNYRNIQGGPFSSLFPNLANAQSAQQLVEQVFSTRKTQILEGVLKIEQSMIWGRAHIRSLKMGPNGSVLVLIEDLTLEKTQLQLQAKLRKELEKRVEERTSDLKNINEQLQKEVRERKRAEQELRAGEARYRILSENFPNGSILMLDYDSRFMVADGLGLARMGLSKEMMVGKTVFEVFPSDTCALVGPLIEQALEGKSAVREVPFGDQILEARALPIRKESGQVAAALVMTQDITERKRAEEELKKHRNHLQELVAERTSELNSSIKRLKQEVRERKQAEQSLRTSERRFNVAFRANPGCVCISTLEEGRYLEVNDSFCRTTCYTRDEVIGKTFRELNEWAYPNQRVQMVRMLKEKGAVRDFEVVLRTKDAKMILGSLAAEIVELDGEAYVLATIMDVTERKRAEADRQRLTTAIEQSAESILITDARGIVRYANPAFEAMSGFSRKEIVGSSTGLFRSPTKDKSILADMKLKVGKGLPWKGRLLNKKKDGTFYQVETTISPVRTNAGRVINFVIVERDVTHEVRLERRLRQAQKMEAIGNLAGGIAHDFNNILMAMMGFLHLAKERLPETSPEARDLAEALKAGGRARDLIAQILAFSRQSEQEMRPVEVGLVVKECLKLIRASIPVTIDIRQEIGPDPGTVMADPTQLHQVIMNLCTNGYHAMERGHGVLTVGLTAEVIDQEAVTLNNLDVQPGSYVKLSVTDTGKGMTNDVIERIFEPYFTTKEPGKGTGMGLAVVHGIVKAHGGGVSVTSEPSIGTTVAVYLPRCEDSAPVERIGTDQVALGSERILFVDDDVQIVEICKRILTSLGYRVEVSTDPKQALDLFRARHDEFDLVITDLSMPHLTGLELAKKMLAVRSDIPVVLCTGFAETLTPQKLKDAGIRDFLMKPVLPGALGKAVREVLGR